MKLGDWKPNCTKKKVKLVCPHLLNPPGFHSAKALRVRIAAMLFIGGLFVGTIIL
jgi:hypothetical protein